MKYHYTKYLLSCSMLCLLVSCGGSGGGSASAPATANMSTQPIPSTGGNSNTTVETPTIPVNTAAQVSLIDTDGTLSQIGGDIEIIKALDESDITGYSVRWGDDNRCTLPGSREIVTIAATGDDLSFTLPDNTPVPIGASSLVVYSYNEAGEMDNCENVGATITDTFVEPAPTGPEQIKVLSYNTGFNNTPSIDDKSQLTALIARASADIIGFQELSLNARGDIERALVAGYNFYDGNNSVNSNPIALKKGAFTLLEQGAIPLSIEGCISNYLVSYVRLQTPAGNQFMVYNDHFCRANPDGHAQQFTEKVNALYPDLPMIFTGDLNANENSPVMNYLLNQGDLTGNTSAIAFYDTWRLKFSSDSKAAKDGAMDWVLISDPNALQVLDKSVIDDRRLSDHDPISVTLKFFEQTANTFKLPKRLSGKMVDGKRVYDLNMQLGQTEFFDGQLTDTMGYNGSFFGPTIMMRKNEQVVLNVTNNIGQMTTNHWHGFHIPANMDGGPHQKIMPDATWSPTFKVMNRAGMYWYHPHIMSMEGDEESGTSWQVWQGLAGQIIINDDISDTLPIPKTYGIDDIPLTIQDRQFDDEAQFREPPYRELGYNGWMRKGSTVLVNGAVTPTLQSHAQVIRLRLHNGSNARTFNFGFGDNRTFYQVATDGGFLEKPVPLTRLLLSSGERAEILVDFGKDEGKTITLRSFAAELGNIYVPDGLDDLHDRTDYDVMTITVGSATERPITKITDTTLMTIDAPLESSAVNADSPRVFAMSSTGMVINGKQMDVNRIDETITLGDTEVWDISNDGRVGEQAHPFHIHGDSFYILSREYEGEVTLPPENERGWKDVVLVRPGEHVKVIKRFLDFADPETPFMYHCHILRHEDNGMMGQWVVVEPQE